MSNHWRHELFEEVRIAFGAADRDGTAALNVVILGGAVTIASSVTLVAVGGVAGVLLWALVWLAAVAALALWLSPHLGAASERRRTRALVQGAVLEAARQRAVDLVLADTTPDAERRAAADLLVGKHPAGVVPATSVIPPTSRPPHA